MAEPSSTRVLCIALDACDVDVLTRFASEGRCPNVARLLDDGAVVDTVAPYGTFVGSSWMTISTGSSVGSHRYWNWLEVDPDTYALLDTTPRQSRRPPFWLHLSDAGRRVAVIDVPHADVPAHLNGLLVKEWGCHDRHHGTASYPTGLLAELEASAGRHPYGSMIHPAGYDAFAPCDYTLREGLYRTYDEERRLLDLMVQGVDRKADLSLALLDRGPWDLFLTVFGESHCVGHQFWHVHDPTHPRHDPDTRRLLGDPVALVYGRIDAAIGRLLDRVGPTTTVWLQLNHGMGPHYDGEHLLDEVLVRIDRATGGERSSTGWRSRVVRPVIDRMPAALAPFVAGAVAAAVRRRARVAPPVASPRPALDPTRRFFQVPGNTAVGAVRFNLAGREAAGTVTPGPELERLRDEVAGALMGLINVDTGRPAVRSVVPAEEVVARSEDDRLPDLFIEWDRSTPTETVWSPVTGTVHAPYDHWRTGDHLDRGLVLVRSPDLAPGRRSTPMRLEDVAPTMAALIDCSLPGVDGIVRTDLVAGRDPASPPQVPRSLRPTLAPTRRTSRRRAVHAGRH